MSGLETLPPDQRAVLQLILTQGRGYAELARMLRIDASAVRIRAHAGIDALAGASADAPDAARRAQISDYLLGQQDEGERLVTLVELTDSAAACRWAAALRAQLQPLAREPLPEVPEPVATNGTVAAAALAAPISAPAIARPSTAPTAPPPAPVAAEPPAAAPAPPAVAPFEPAAAAPPPAVVAAPPAAAPVASPPTAVAAAHAPADPAPPAEPPAGDTPPPSGPSPSRRGGAILLGAAVGVVLAVVLAIVLIGGDGDDDPTSAAQTTPTQTTGGQTPTTPTGQPAGKIVAQVNLLATPEGGQAVGLGFVQRVKRQLGIAIQADKLPANGAEDIYAAWISGPPGTKLLGFVPNQVKANGTFTVSAGLPADAQSYDSILITREAAAEGSAVPTQPGEAIMRGTLTLP